MMDTLSTQPGLFDPDRESEGAEALVARVRMRDMIARLGAAAVPPWKDQMEAILEDGAFQRAMRLVPQGEAQALWAEFDAQMERLYAIWIRAESSSS